MMKSVRLVLLLAITASLVSTSCSSRKQVAPQREAEPATGEEAVDEAEEASARIDKPTRIILLIGDGMGVPAISAASYAQGEPLSMLDMTEMGLMTTHSYEFVTTDSAASATAIATGRKTHYEGVSVEPGTTAQNESDPDQHMETLLERAEKAGWKTGLVSTSKIVHATPAAFASHRAHRHSYEGIAADMAGSGVDVLLGGGPRYFNKRADGRDLLAEMQKAGYTIADSANTIAQASKLADKLVGLPHDPDFPPAGSPERAMTLAQMTSSAIEVLDRENEEGFFLMVEGSQIDWRGHDLDGAGVVEEMLDFDAAVRTALEYARGRDDTLVLTTADHETGGLAVLDPHYSQRFTKALGGDAKANALTAWPEGAGAEAGPPAVAHLPMRQASRQDRSLVPAYLEDRRLSTVFGHLSLASRGECTTPGEFSGLHTPSLVPIFAEGKAADYVSSAADNADLGRRIASLIGPDQVSVRRSPAESGPPPRNIIVMVGDGLGIGALTAANYGRGKLAMRSLPVKGLVATHAADRLVTDSAAGGTALAIGYSTNKGAVGMKRTKAGLEPAETLLEKAERLGKRTGLVTTTTLTHATPAAFYAHHPDRGEEAKIAAYFVDMPERVAGSDGIDLAFGGGAAAFGKGIKTLQERGVIVQTRWSDELPADKQVVRFLGKKGLDSATERHSDDDAATPTLRQMTETALQGLSRSNDGFVLVVEGGQIDWLQHQMARGDDFLDEVVDFDQAVAAAYDFARRDGNTLVVVTSDHDHTTSVIDDHYEFDNCSCAAATECGGDYELEKLAAAVEHVDHNEGLSDKSLQGAYAPLEIALQYAWLPQAAIDHAGGGGPHSANFVPLFAYGPHAERLEGFHVQSEVGQLLQRSLE